MDLDLIRIDLGIIDLLLQLIQQPIDHFGMQVFWCIPLFVDRV